MSPPHTLTHTRTHTNTHHFLCLLRCGSNGSVAGAGRVTNMLLLLQQCQEPTLPCSVKCFNSQSGTQTGVTARFNWVPELFWGCWSVQKKKHIWHLWTQLFFSYVADAFIWSSKLPFGYNSLKKYVFQKGFTSKREKKNRRGRKKYHV